MINTPPEHYWHGLGRCLDLASVTEIKPRSMLNDPLALVASRDEPHGVAEYAHASTDKAVALAFSVLSRGAAVCEVDPGQLVPEHDDDFPSLGVRFHGPLRVLSMKSFARTELPHARQIVELLAPDKLSVLGQRWHHLDGRIQPPPLWRSWGYTEDDFDWLGPWYPDECVWQDPANNLVHAVIETGDMFTVWPATRSLPGGATRYKPVGTLTARWKTAGDVPAVGRLRKLVPRATVRSPWEW